jgi:hypothetical protein
MDISSIIEQAISHCKILERLDRRGMDIVYKGEGTTLRGKEAV